MSSNELTGEGHSSQSSQAASESASAQPSSPQAPSPQAPSPQAPAPQAPAPQAPSPQAPSPQAQHDERASRSDNPAQDFERPLSYAELRRFLGLISLMAVTYVLIRAIAPTLILFTVVFMLAMVLNPMVTAMERRGIKRAPAVVIIMLLLVGILIGVGMLVVPAVLDEINVLAQHAPGYWETIRAQTQHLTQRYPALDRFLPEIQQLQDSSAFDMSRLSTYAQQILTYTFGLVGAIFGLVVAILLLVFTLLNPKPLVSGFLRAVPERHREASVRALERTQGQMTAWARATLINGVITGITTGVLLAIIGVQPALVFGVLAFFGEFVPNIGPIVAAAPALFVALGMGPAKLGQALLAILFVQQVESNLLVPFVMGRSMELHPATIIFFALAMGSVLGIVGAILAVPTAAIVKILFDEFYARPQRTSREALDERAGDLVAGRFDEPDSKPNQAKNETS